MFYWQAREVAAGLGLRRSIARVSMPGQFNPVPWALLMLLLTLLIGGGAVRAIEPTTPRLDAGSFSYAGDRLPVRLPAGLKLTLVNAALEAPRLFEFLPGGELIVGSRSGNVYRLQPPYTRAEVLMQLADYPHSIAYRSPYLYIATTSGLLRFGYKPGQARVSPADRQEIAGLPHGGGHNSRTVIIGPDGRIYVSLGLRGNCSDEYIGSGYDFDDWRGGVMVLDEKPEPARWRPFATGLRNPVGFAFQPRTGVGYASNNGPDHLGFDQPPEVFARLIPGSFHGMPWFQFDGTRVFRDRCASGTPPKPREQVNAPVATFPARSAPMGVAFVPANSVLGSEYEGDAVVALHGSWATQPDGGSGGAPASRREPKLVLVRFAGETPGPVADLLSGFQLADGHRWARPVGVGFGPDGALYFTSDAGLEGLYRLERTRP